MKKESADIRMDDFMKERRAHGNLEYPVAVYQVDLRNLYMGFVRWHWHEELEIDVVLEGRMECLIGDNSYILQKGDAIFINQNMMHSIHPLEDDPGIFYAIVFHPTLLFSYGQTYLNTKYLIPIIGNSNLKTLIMNKDYPHFEEVSKIFHELIDANIDLPLGYELITKSCLCRFWILMIHQFGIASETSARSEAISMSETRAKDAVIYMQTHYSEPITLDEIAAAIHVSKSECCRCFKKTLRCSPFEYLMKYRIYMGSMKIRQDMGNHLSFSEVAVSVGFNNASYFNKLFKSYLGCTPSQYRKNLIDGSTEDTTHFSQQIFDDHAMLLQQLT